MLISRVIRSLHVPETVFSLVRSFGFKETMQNRNIEKQKEEFIKEINFMASKPAYTLNDYRQRILDGIAKPKKSFFSKFTSNNDETEVYLIQQRKILNAMFEEELLDPENLTRSLIFDY